jgi:hypothetical protein
MSQATSDFQLAAAQGALAQVLELYEEALRVDAQSLEVLCQYAQMKTLVGDTEAAVALLRQAVPLVRAREEAFELAHMLVTNECQLAAQQQIIANNSSPAEEQQ